MSTSRETVDYVAELAKLRLDDAEKERLGEQLERILGFVEQLDRADVADVPPTKHVIGLTNVERADRTRPSLPLQEALGNAPETDEDHFLVPKVLPD